SVRGGLGGGGWPGGGGGGGGAAGGGPLDWELSRRRDALAREDRAVSSCRRGHRGCVTAGPPADGVRGCPRGGTRPRRGAAAGGDAAPASALHRRTALPPPPPPGALAPVAPLPPPVRRRRSPVPLA